MCNTIGHTFFRSRHWLSTPVSIFGFFLFMMVLHLLWAIFLVPETKGRQLEEMSNIWK